MLSIISNAIFKISVVSFYVGQYELLTTGLAPEKVRSSIISGLGESIIERALPNDAKCEIFF